MTRRIAIMSAGIYVSPPGLDALGGYDDSIMLFSPTIRHMMLVGSGSFVLSPGYRVDFGLTKPLPSIPLVMCGPYHNMAPKYPVVWVPDQWGFTVSPQTKPDGTAPANGQICIWQAFLRNRS